MPDRIGVIFEEDLFGTVRLCTSTASEIFSGVLISSSFAKRSARPIVQMLAFFSIISNVCKKQVIDKFLPVFIGSKSAKLRNGSLVGVSCLYEAVSSAQMRRNYGRNLSKISVSSAHEAVSSSVGARSRF